MKWRCVNRVSNGVREYILRRSGMTLIELMIAALILTMSLIGLLTAWMFSVQHSIQTDAEAASYECARLVMERARSIGYLAPSGQSATQTQPANNTEIATPALQHFRFFDAELNELSSNNNSTMPPIPFIGVTAYVAVTEIPPTPISTYPGDRDDLAQMNLTVWVYQVDAQGNVAANPLTTLQTIVAEGGL